MVINNGRMASQRRRRAPAANTELRVVAWPSRSHTRHGNFTPRIFAAWSCKHYSPSKYFYHHALQSCEKAISLGEITQVFSAKPRCLRPRQTLRHVRKRLEGIISIRFLYPVTYVHVNVPSNVSSSQRRTIWPAHVISLHHANVPLEAVR